MISHLTRRLANRNTLPRIVNAAIDHVAKHPMGLLGRLAARRLGRPNAAYSTAVTTFPAASFSDRAVRVLIAPVNYSGQGREWARALEQHNPAITARNMAIEVPAGFAYKADLEVPVPTYQNDRHWQLRQMEAAAQATHLLLEAEEPPFGRLLGRSTARQLEALIDRGVDVAFMCHGTDIRLPSRHLERTPWSMYGDPSVYTPRLEYLALRNKELLDHFERTVFVSTPDLLADVENAYWCPVVVDPERWRFPQDHKTPINGPLRVVHAPSVAALKGTPLVMPTLERLHDEGIINYQLISGVSSSQMPAVYHEADILLDQFRAGSYGVAACEAMAAGCLVIGHVLNDVRETVQQSASRSLPIVEATAGTLEAVLRALADDHQELRAKQAESVDFVRNLHDGRFSAGVLAQQWIRSPRP